jgi:mono/diheme cytochrome c family protein
MKATHQIVLALALAGGVATAAPALAADAQKGREVYVKAGCWECHGYNGQGGSTGPRLAPNPLAVEAMTAFIRSSDRTQMPPYAASSISDEDAANIHAYLSSLPKAADWKSIPALAP